MATLIKDVIVPGLTDDRIDLVLDHGILRKFTQDYQLDHSIEGKDLYLIPSFTDLGTFNGEPGYEERETLETLTQAAANGGYGSLIILPASRPIADEGSSIESLGKKTGLNDIEIHPLGAVSVGTDGIDLAEMLDMVEAGAVGFTDGYKSIQSAGLMIRALDYAKRFNNVIVNLPLDESIASDGFMHEGEVSTRMGLKGIPAIAESMMVMRDLELLKYTGSRLHLWNITTARSLELVKNAKAAGLDVTCSVSFIHLIKNENALENFDAIYKVNPPLRSERDRSALIKGLLEGTIDCISSMHRPWDEEHKNLEFVHAKSGVAGIEIAYASVWTYVPELRDMLLLNKLFNSNVREIFGLKPNEAQWNKPFKATLVDLGQSFIFDESHIKSKGKNYPLMGEKFNLKIQKL